MLALSAQDQGDMFPFERISSGERLPNFDQSMPNEMALRLERFMHSGMSGGSMRSVMVY